MDAFSFAPIGIFSCEQQYPQQAPRQGILNRDKSLGRLTLKPGTNFEQALQDLDSFEKIWLLYVFDRNPHWKPLISPPRGGRKRGVFGSRAPYRPNPIGLSCVTLVELRGLDVIMQDFDLLDGTPVLDIKPYLAYADSFPNASMGWLENDVPELYSLSYSMRAEEKIQWVREQADYDISSFIISQLSESPCDQKRKRVSGVSGNPNAYVIAARTWRICFSVDEKRRLVHVEDILSGYSAEELDDPQDKYGDKAAHGAFVEKFS
ncbi:MAG: tRNA-Thr(GGU) m(6)t(6)A37 methyltransferase TsaA [Rhodothermales bacterium]